MATLIKIDKNGSKHYEGMITCDRCNGTGIYVWGAIINGRPQHAGTCFKCEGAGKVFDKWIERTPEYEAKLAAKRQAKADALAAEYEKLRKEQEAKAEAERLAEEARIKAQKAVSQYQGEVGQKITVDIVEAHTATFETHFGWKTQTMHIHIMKDAAGNIYTWKTQNSLGFYEEAKDGEPYAFIDDKGRHSNWIHAEELDCFTIKGTIKDHSVYEDEKQTVLTRCKVSRKEGE